MCALISNTALGGFGTILRAFEWEDANLCRDSVTPRKPPDASHLCPSAAAAVRCAGGLVCLIFMSYDFCSILAIINKIILSMIHRHSIIISFSYIY